MQARCENTMKIKSKKIINPEREFTNLILSKFKFTNLPMAIHIEPTKTGELIDIWYNEK